MPARRRATEEPRASVRAALDALGPLEGASVLDAGCGDGVHLRAFADRVGPHGRVVGAELDAGRAAAAAAVAPDLGVVRADVASLPFAADTFDLVWCSAVLHHVESPSAAVAELARVLRPGGRLAVLEGDVLASFPFLAISPELELALREAALRGERDWYGGRLGPFHGLLARELPALLRDAGCTDVMLTPLSDVDRAPLGARRQREILRWLRGPFADRIQRYARPADWDDFMSSVGELVAGPNFFFVRTSFLVYGTVATLP